MRKFMSLLLTLSMCVGVVAHADDKTVIYTGQTTANLELSSKTSHEVWEDENYTDTCTRTVIDGYRTVCENTIRRECQIDHVCRNVPDEICRLLPPRTECENISRRVCENDRRCIDVPGETCSNEPDRTECIDGTKDVCSTKKVCKNALVDECKKIGGGKQICHKVTRRVCEDVNECHKTPERICKTYPGKRTCRPTTKQKCTDVPRCHNVPDRVCRTVPGRRECTPIVRRECGDVQRCFDVPDRICREVPITREEQYSCTKTRRVFKGVEQDYAVQANVNFEFDELPSNITPNETFNVTLDGDQLGIRLTESSKTLLLVMTKDINVDVKKKKEGNKAGLKVITANIRIKAQPIFGIEKPVKHGVKNIVLNDKIMSFDIGAFNPDLGNLAIDLKIGTSRFLIGDAVWLDQAVPSEALSIEPLANDRSKLTIDLSYLGASNWFYSGTFNVTTKVRFVPNIPEGTLNPELIRRLDLQPLVDYQKVTLP